MVADFWTKPLQGSHFSKLRDYIMGRVRCVKPKADAVSISKAAKKKVSKISKQSGLHCSCENILHGYLYVFDLAFVILEGVYSFEFPKRFLGDLFQRSHFFSSLANLKT